MPRTLYCRHQDCRAAYVSHAGKVPAVCPACKRTGAWSSEPGTEPIVGQPSRAYALTEGDRRMLRSFRIDPEG